MEWKEEIPSMERQGRVTAYSATVHNALHHLKQLSVFVMAELTV